MQLENHHLAPINNNLAKKQQWIQPVGKFNENGLSV